MHNSLAVRHTQCQLWESLFSLTLSVPFQFLNIMSWKHNLFFWAKLLGTFVVAKAAVTKSVILIFTCPTVKVHNCHHTSERALNFDLRFYWFFLSTTVITQVKELWTFTKAVILIFTCHTVKVSNCHHTTERALNFDLRFYWFSLSTTVITQAKELLNFDKVCYLDFDLPHCESLKLSSH